MRNINIYGPPGSGKTRHIADILEFFAYTKYVDEATLDNISRILILHPDKTIILSQQKLDKVEQNLHIDYVLSLLGERE